MKKQRSICNITINLLMTLLFIISNAIPTSWAIDNVQCDLLNSGGSFNVLTINLLFSEVKTRQSRLENIAKFVADKDIHVILLQEVVGGILADTNNSADDLRDILSKTYGLQYDLRTEFEVSLPDLGSEGNAILSRCQIEFGQNKQLPGTDEEFFNGTVIKFPRNVMMLRLTIPGFGDIDVYNTHLCSSCPTSDRLKQLDALLAFLNDVEQNAPDSHPIVLGGDLNTDIFKDDGTEKPVYDKIIGEGFIDSYAYYQARLNPTTHDILEKLCPQPEVPDKHCTIGVSNLGDSKTRRIDYLFIRNFGAVKESRVVFNTKIHSLQPTVSDHAGVFTRVRLPDQTLQDTDGDSIPDVVELDLGTNPLVKDNDVFSNAHLFVMQQYRDFLHREGDSGGIGYWENQLNSQALTRVEEINSFLTCAEFASQIAPVTRLFFAYFQQIPDYDNLTYWTQEFRRGMPLANISQVFADSDEFQTTYAGLDNAHFVTRVYQNVLRREPDPEGGSYWTNQLDNGALTRAQVLLAFSESAEYQAIIANEITVTLIYVGMLQRSPDQAGFDFWVSQLDSGVSLPGLIQSFLNSPEYYHRFL